MAQVVALQLEDFKENLVEVSLKSLPKSSVVVLPEYVINPFFHHNMALEFSEIHAQSMRAITHLENCAKEKDLIISAPVLLEKDHKIYKKIALISKNSIKYYEQQRLIPYSHWDEESFFDNEKSDFKELLVFEKEGLRFAPMFGFEAHFDEIWVQAKKQGVDVVLLSSVATFESNERWRDLCKMRAFCASCMIVRANRIGAYQQVVQKQDEKSTYLWKFYGDSFIALPDGSIENSLQGKMNMLSTQVDKHYIREWAKTWSFREIN
ncbi:carbon-nitrogen hydrolase family protein [Helicobacter cetorum]|uniref:carbon-nitrogen hydrolase family protein n=1 Tax=Helicobacter cetorum TaxID=138563 RepID=UPI000CF0187D|nr:carbon-nitrogen hydrolase family protein [Helicobacter cetorum]